jgi:fucose permease
VKGTYGDARGGFARDSSTWMTYGLVGYFAFMETVLGPIMPFLRTELGLDYTTASLHFSAFALGAVLLGLFGDRLLGRFGRLASLWGGAFGMAAGAVLLILIPSAFGTVPAALAMGLCGALLLVTSQAMLSDKYGEWRSVAVTESNVAASACAISAPLFVGVSASSGLGWRTALILPVAVLVLLATAFFLMPPDLPHRAAGDGESSGGRGLSPRYWAFWALVTLGVASEWCVAYWGTDFLADGTGLGRPAAATSLTAFFAAMLLGRIASSRLARVLSPAALLAANLGLSLVGFPLFWYSPGSALTLIGLFVTGLGIGGVYPLGVSAAIAEANDTDAAASRLAIGGGGAILVAPFVLGALADRIGIASAFGIVVPMLLAALSLALIAGRSDRRVSA